jgi:hypothetical protein
MAKSKEVMESEFTKAQMRRFNELQTELRRAQSELQSFINYLTEEHELDETKQWQIGPKGFVAQSANGNGVVQSIEEVAG